MTCLFGNSASMFVRGGKVVSAVRVIRVLANASNRLLVMATDGRMYVLKLYDNQTKNQRLLKESLGTELAATLGLPVPRWNAVHISEQFLDTFADLWKHLERPTAGYYFGSEMIGQDLGERISDTLPRRYLEKIDNRSDFVGALLLDVWACSAGHRQTVFLNNVGSDAYKAVFIGFSQMFSSHSDISAKAGSGRYSDAKIYEGQWSESVFSFWQRKILSLRESKLRALPDRLPDEWIASNNAEQMIVGLVAGQKLIKRLQFRSFDPRSQSWNHPGGGASIPISAFRNFTRVAFCM